MIYLFEIYLLTCILFLAGKDADSYLMKIRATDAITGSRVNRWHRDGVALFILYLAPLIVWDSRDAWKIVVAGGLLRLSVFDLAFNSWASLPVTYLGGTAWADRVFTGIFGVNGAVRKSITFLAILIAGNLLNHFL